VLRCKGASETWAREAWARGRHEAADSCRALATLERARRRGGRRGRCRRRLACAQWTSTPAPRARPPCAKATAAARSAAASAWSGASRHPSSSTAGAPHPRRALVGAELGEEGAEVPGRADDPTDGLGPEEGPVAHGLEPALPKPPPEPACTPEAASSSARWMREGTLSHANSTAAATSSADLTAHLPVGRWRQRRVARSRGSFVQPGSAQAGSQAGRERRGTSNNNNKRGWGVELG